MGVHYIQEVGTPVASASLLVYSAETYQGSWRARSLEGHCLPLIGGKRIMASLITREGLKGEWSTHGDAVYGGVKAEPGGQDDDGEHESRVRPLEAQRPREGMARQ